MGKAIERSWIDESEMFRSNFALKLFLLPIFIEEKPIRFTIEIKYHFQNTHSFYFFSFSLEQFISFTFIIWYRMRGIYHFTIYSGGRCQNENTFSSFSFSNMQRPNGYENSWAFSRHLHLSDWSDQKCSGVFSENKTKTNKTPPKNNNRKLISTRRLAGVEWKH